MRRERGIALLVALILVALATAIAGAIVFETGLGLRRAEGGAAQDQALQLAAGAEAIAARILVEELAGGDAAVHEGQRWHNPIGPLEPLEGVRVTARMTDLQGRFNLNSLVDAEGRVDPQSLAVFRRLLSGLDLEPEWADRMADWIDADDEPLPAGAEDAVYSAAVPSYRTPNRAITSVSELLALDDLGAARYARLAPFVSALPRDASINVCTASAELLDALSGERQWRDAPDALRRGRERGCFPGLDALRTTLGTAGYDALHASVGLGDRSTHFRLDVETAVGSTGFTLYSLLRATTGAEGPARVRVMSRQFAE
jgi:general secretion pathway protein K